MPCPINCIQMLLDIVTLKLCQCFIGAGGIQPAESSVLLILVKSFKQTLGSQKSFGRSQLLSTQAVFAPWHCAIAALL